MAAAQWARGAAAQWVHTADALWAVRAAATAVAADSKEPQASIVVSGAIIKPVAQRGRRRKASQLEYAAGFFVFYGNDGIESVEVNGLSIVDEQRQGALPYALPFVAGQQSHA